jgi:hypothetical protein
MARAGARLRRLGGNFAVAPPDTALTARRCALRADRAVSTKLNRSHLVPAARRR